MQREPGAPGWIATVVAGLVVALAFTGAVLRWDLLVDDAFIAFRYAVNLADSQGLVFNAGERVEGYSSLLWIVVLAGLAALGVAPPDAAPILGYAAGLLTLLLVYWAARRVLACAPLPAWIACVVLAVSPSFTFWAGAGLESALFAWLVLAAWVGPWSSWRRRAAGRFWLALLVAAAALTRPEGLVLAGAWAAAVLWGDRASWRRWIGPMTLLSVLVAAHLAWRHHYYGSLLPNPYYAKVSPSWAAAARGARYLGEFTYEEGWLLLVPALAYARWRSARLITLASIVVGCAAFVIYVGGDGLYRYRFAAHVLPCLVLVLGAGLHRVWQERPRWFGVVALGVAVIAVWPMLGRSFFREFTVEQVREWERRWQLVGQALAAHAPSGCLLATNVAGRVPYYSGLPTLDLLGLTDAVVARTPVPGLGTGYVGHERAAPDYVIARRPDVFYFSVLDGLPAPAFERLAVGRSVLRAGSLYRYVPLLDAPDFVRDYVPASLLLPDGESANLYVRATLRDRLPADAGLHLGAWQD